MAASANAGAYDIKTDTPVLKLAAIHEMMTRAAIACDARAAAVGPLEKPSNCWNPGINAEAASVRKEDITPQEGAVRWSDDPTRQGVASSYAKLGLSLAKGCKDHVQTYKAVDSAGLLCSSHYGRLQFLHAMRGIDDSSSADTRKRILAWARFAYEVASGDDSLIEQSLCDAAKGRDGLEDALAFDNPRKCYRRRGFLGLFGNYPAYTVRTLFTLSCKGVGSSVRCNETRSGPKGREEAMLAATGSLLHLIQDSYSQAHNSRSTGAPIDPKGPFDPKIVCRLPTEFFDYSGQDKDVHGAADHQANLDPSCSHVGATDDPVTASAILLWHLRTGQSADSFVAYLKAKVIGD